MGFAYLFQKKSAQGRRMEAWALRVYRRIDRNKKSPDASGN
jgi:hypothetical protein